MNNLSLSILPKAVNFGWHKLKAPFAKAIFFIRYEYNRKPPLHFKYHGYQVYYEESDGLVAHVARGESYEKEVLEAALKYIEGKAVVFDIGANIGFITLALAAKKPETVFHCFEPSPIPYQCLLKTVKSNRLEERILINNIGLFNKKSIMPFYVHKTRDNSGDGIKDTYRSGGTKKITIPVITLDSYVKNNKVNRIDLIKIDVEGAELPILEGAIQTLKKYKPVIIFEAWQTNLIPYNINGKQIFDFFHKVNYRIYDLNGNLLNSAAFSNKISREPNYMALPYE